MKHVLVVGSGLSGLSCALHLAESGISSTLVSPYPSERAQSVMAAGGINAALGADDSSHRHAEDTLKSGGSIAGKDAVESLCSAAPDMIRWLEGLGVVFSRDERGEVALRAFGGQSRNRTESAPNRKLHRRKRRNFRLDPRSCGVLGGERAGQLDFSRLD